jgi:hypothetical protein
MKNGLVWAAAVGVLAFSACSSSSGGESPSGTDGTGASAATAGTGSATSASSTTGGMGAASAASTSTGPDTDTWANYAEAFTKTYCVECHSPTVNPTYDFTQYALVKKNASTIRCGVAPTLLSGCMGFPPPLQFPISDGKTPPNPKPDDAERDRFVAWIEAGTPE